MSKALFIRHNASFSSRSDEHLAHLRELLHSEGSIEDFIAEVVGMSLVAEFKHSSKKHTVFYKKLFETILEATQDLKHSEVLMGLGYLESMDFAGFAPVFKANTAMNSAELVDVEPVFNLYAQDDTVVPTKTLFARVSVTQSGQLTVQKLDTSFLKRGKESGKNLIIADIMASDALSSNSKPKGTQHGKIKPTTKKKTAKV